MPTPSLHHILDDVCMRYFGADTTTGIPVIAVASPYLVENTVDGLIVIRVWICTEKAGEMVDVPAGEAEKWLLL